MTAPVIELDGVSFAFDGRHPVLSDVTLAVEPLSFACVVGPNGGGKTTLLKLILGLLEPTAGRIRVLGTSPAAGPPPDRLHAPARDPRPALPGAASSTSC